MGKWHLSCVWNDRYDVEMLRFSSQRNHRLLLSRHLSDGVGLGLRRLFLGLRGFSIMYALWIFYLYTHMHILICTQRDIHIWMYVYELNCNVLKIVFQPKCMKPIVLPLIYVYMICIYLAKDSRHVFHPVVIYYEKPGTVHELWIHPEDEN